MKTVAVIPSRISALPPSLLPLVLISSTPGHSNTQNPRGVLIILCFLEVRKTYFSVLALFRHGGAPLLNQVVVCPAQSSGPLYHGRGCPKIPLMLFSH